MFNPAEIPAWVSGSSQGDGSTRKYLRAIEALKKEGKEVTEEAIKALYVKYGGLVLEVEAVEPEPVEEPKKGKK